MTNKKVLGIDIGGTKIFSSIINESGEIEGEVKRFDTPKSSVEIEKLLSEIIKEKEDVVDYIGIATAGAINCENTKVISATGNLPQGYRDIDFSSLSKKPLCLENDANCASWAEYMVGSARGYSNNITITLGTGVGGGIIIDGKLLKGKSGSAGEMHFKMSRHKKRKCTCGSWDCFEIYTSGRGLVLTGEELTGEKMTSYEIIKRAQGGEKSALEILAQWESDIVDGFIGLSNIFDPDCIVLSGSMAQFVHTDEIEKRVNAEISTQPIKVLIASAGNYSGMIGAGLLAIKKFGESK